MSSTAKISGESPLAAIPSFTDRFHALRKAVPFKHIHPVYLRTGPDGGIFFIPFKFEMGDPDVLSLIKIKGSSLHLPAFDNTAALANLAERKGLGPPVLELIRRGLIPLFESQQEPPKEDDSVLEELSSAAAALQKDLVFLSDERLYVLVDNLPEDTQSEIKLKDGSSVHLALFSNTNNLIKYLEFLRAAAAAAEGHAATTQRMQILGRQVVPREIRNRIEIDPRPPLSLWGGEQGCFVDADRRIFAVSYIGGRTAHQDSLTILLLSNGELLIVLADGLGGLRAGHTASYLAAKYVPSAFKHRLSLADALKYADDKIKEAGSSDHKSIRRKTTVVSVLVAGKQTQFVHLGDSRYYLIKRDGTIQLMTKDHSGPVKLLEDDPDHLRTLFPHFPELKDAYEKAQGKNWLQYPLSGNTLEEFQAWLDAYPSLGEHPGVAESYGKHRVTKTLGGLKEQELPPPPQSSEIEPGDLILLCGDGVTYEYLKLVLRNFPGVLRDIEKGKLDQNSPADVVRELLGGITAIEDNFSLVLLECPGAAKEAAGETLQIPLIVLQLRSSSTAEAALLSIINDPQAVHPEELATVKNTLQEIISRDPNQERSELAAAALALLEN